MKSAAKVYFDLTILLVFREWRRVFREPSRIAGMLAQPLLFLLVFGLGFEHSFRPKGGPDVGYAAYFFPGILGLVLLFSSIYATLTLVDDKKCGFFRLVLLSPGGVFGALFGKVMATLTLGFLQSALFLALLLFLPLSLSFAHSMWVLLLLAVGSLCFSLLGVLFAWISPSASAFHALMSIFLLPLWLISGAMFPLDNVVLAQLARLNPMAHLVAGLRAEFSGSHDELALLSLSLFCALFAALLWRAVKRTEAIA